jgi:hypothetical protein
VSILLDGEIVAHTTASVGEKGIALPFDLPARASLEPQIMDCIARVDGAHQYTSQTEFLYLPQKSTGSAARLDRATGALEVKRDMSHDWEEVFPFGFYDVGQSQTSICERFMLVYQSRRR